MDMIEWLQNWYIDNCNGDWEHCYGIKIGTLDNPGWYIDIDLIDTDSEGKDFEIIDIQRNESDWIHCSVNNGVFVGHGGIKNLKEILHIFYKWVS